MSGRHINDRHSNEGLSSFAPRITEKHLKMRSGTYFRPFGWFSFSARIVGQKLLVQVILFRE